MPRYSLTQAELESMRLRLCEGALALFRDHGIDAVTFRGLADSLGVSHTLPYRYFENKDALLAAVRVMCFAEFERFVRERESAATSESPATSELARVLAVVDAYVDFVFQHPVEYTLIFVTAQPPPQRYPELLAARRSLFEHSVELVRRCVQMGVVQGDPREITHAVWAACTACSPCTSPTNSSMAAVWRNSCDRPYSGFWAWPTTTACLTATAWFKPTR